MKLNLWARFKKTLGVVKETPSNIATGVKVMKKETKQKMTKAADAVTEKVTKLAVKETVKEMTEKVSDIKHSISYRRLGVYIAFGILVMSNVILCLRKSAVNIIINN